MSGRTRRQQRRSDVAVAVWVLADKDRKETVVTDTERRRTSKNRLLCGKLIVCDVIWHLPQVFYSVWETDCMRCYLASPSSFLKLHWPVQVQFNASHGK